MLIGITIEKHIYNALKITGEVLLEHIGVLSHHLQVRKLNVHNLHKSTEC